MTNLLLINTFAIKAVTRFISKRSKSTKQNKPVFDSNKTFNEIKGDAMDYDGMGNYGRFPCINK